MLHALPEDGGHGAWDAVARGGDVRWHQSRPFDVGNTIGTVMRAAAGEARRARMAEGMRQHSRLASQANGALMRESPLGSAGAGRRGAR